MSKSDVSLLLVAGEERVAWGGLIIELLSQLWPSSGTTDTGLEVQRSGEVLARRDFRRRKQAERARQELAAHLQGLSDDDWQQIEDWQALLDQENQGSE